jgi:Tfp pilus assembly protein PilF
MDVCANCGAVYDSVDIYCGKCGVKIEPPEISPFMTQTGLNVADVRSNLGVVYFKMGKFSEALMEFEKVLSRNPDDGRAREMIKKIHEKLDKTEA